MRVLLVFLMLVLILLISSGCLQQPVETKTSTPEEPAVVWTGTFIPYVTPSASPTFQPPTDLPEIPSTPVPSPTPFLHKVKKGETMLAIAIRYGITLEDLQAANLEVDARLLSVDQTLVIPIRLTEGTPELETPTPFEVAVDPARCFNSENGLVCITEIKNDQNVTLESIQIGFGLYDGEDEIISSEVGVAALNRLRSGERMPVTVTFNDFPAASRPEGYYVHAQLLSGFPAAESEENRYVEVEVEIRSMNISASEALAEVSGEIHFTSPASQVWLLGVAYDQQGQAIGMRKWKVETDCVVEPALEVTEVPEGTPTVTSEAPGECPTREFRIIVYSLGPEIQEVKVFSEARP